MTDSGDQEGKVSEHNRLEAIDHLQDAKADIKLGNIEAAETTISTAQEFLLTGDESDTGDIDHLLSVEEIMERKQELEDEGDSSVDDESKDVNRLREDGKTFDADTSIKNKSGQAPDRVGESSTSFSQDTGASQIQLHKFEADMTIISPATSREKARQNIESWIRDVQESIGGLSASMNDLKFAVTIEGDSSEVRVSEDIQGMSGNEVVDKIREERKLEDGNASQ